jgi:hypothetical protein
MLQSLLRQYTAFALDISVKLSRQAISQRLSGHQFDAGPADVAETPVPAEY